MMGRRNKRARTLTGPQSRDKSERWIIEFVYALDGVAKQQPKGTGKDLIIWLRGDEKSVEVKTNPGDPLTDTELALKEELELLGFDYPIVTSPYCVMDLFDFSLYDLTLNELWKVQDAMSNLLTYRTLDVEMIKPVVEMCRRLEKLIEARSGNFILRK